MGMVRKYFSWAKENFEFWNTIFVDSSIGSYIYNTMLKPLWDWISTLFTNPKEGLDQLWTFFKTFDTWIYNTVLGRSLELVLWFVSRCCGKT